MNAKGLKRLIPVGWTGGTRALVDRLADRHVFEASPAQRAEIVRRVEALLASPPIDEDETRARKFDLATAGWKTRAEAASRLSAGGAWTSWAVAGSLGTAGSGESDADARLVSAIVVAARETLLPGIAARHERLRGPVHAALAHEKDGTHLWDEALRPLVTEFAGNARRQGADRRTSALRALSAAAHLKGQAMHPASAEGPFLLGAAASSLLREDEDGLEDGAPSALEDLVRLIAALNDARATMWDDADAETARLMGAAAAIAAFGRGSVSKPTHQVRVDPHARAHLPVGALRRYAGLTASEAAEALDEEAADPRLEESRRRRLETLSEALRRHPAAHAVSCAEALDMEPPEARIGELKPGMKVFRAVVGGRRRPVLCTGRNGRLVRCRTVAGPDGAFVGYLAFDALSREFGGRPLLAAYAPDGRRYGYAWADERPVIRRGEPEQGFKTAPARIPLE